MRTGIVSLPPLFISLSVFRLIPSISICSSHSVCKALQIEILQISDCLVYNVSTSKTTELHSAQVRRDLMFLLTRRKRQALKAARQLYEFCREADNEAGLDVLPNVKALRAAQTASHL